MGLLVLSRLSLGTEVEKAGTGNVRGASGMTASTVRFWMLTVIGSQVAAEQLEPG